MRILSGAILIFIILESLNILTLYFQPGSKYGNGIGVFNAWERSKSDPEMHNFVRYLVFWVAGTKLIFVALLLVILFYGDRTVKTLTMVAMIVSIASFYWRLYPIIRAMDAKGEISPSGYSRTLAAMIAGFIAIFALALLIVILF